MDKFYIDKVLGGDTEAFRYFLKRYKDMAYNVAISIVKDEHYAEEVTQDAFIKAFKALQSFNRTAKFKSWFYRIVINESFQRLKKMKKEIALSEIEEVGDSIDHRVLQDFDEHQLIDRTKLALKLLPSKESLALNLFYLVDYSLADIVGITGWSLSNTKVILHRARKNIKALLAIAPE